LQGHVANIESHLCGELSEKDYTKCSQGAESWMTHESKQPAKLS